MKKNKKERLQFEKFSVAELNNLQSIKGGGNDLPTNTVTIDLTITQQGNGTSGGAGSSIQCAGG